MLAKQDNSPLWGLFATTMINLGFFKKEARETYPHGLMHEIKQG